MITNNYFKDNQDLMLHFDHLIEWNEIIDQYEHGFIDAIKYAETKDEKFAFAPGTHDEAVEYYRSVLDPLGDLMGTFVAPRSAEMDRTGLKFDNGQVIFPESWNDSYNKLRDAGLMPFGIGRQYGGLGLPLTVQSMIGEISARADAAFWLAFGSANISEIVERFASNELCDQWLPALAAGERSCAMALTEPNYGSNLPGVQTKAILDENGTWRITGTKRFITHACGYIDAPSVILTLARTGTATSGARGLSFFIVDGNDVEIAGIEKKLGIHCSPTCEVVYENSPAQLIGKTGFGLIKYSMGMMNTARITVAAQALGIASAAYYEAKKYASEREQFGKRLNQIPAVKKMLDRMERELSGARCLIMEASRIVDNYVWKKHRMEKDGKSEKDINQDKSIKYWEKLADTFTPIVKYYVSEMSVLIASDAVQIHGGSGYTEEYDVARIYRDSRITTIYEGTTQLQIVGAIGGVVAGMSATGFLRSYINDMMGSYNPCDETRILFAKVEESILEYKKFPRQKREPIAFEVVENATRLLIGILLEKSIALAPKKDHDHRKNMSRQYNIESLAIAEGNLVKISYAG